ncbi:MAG: FHA domain-containing protein [Planctomycetaceae bacterium]|nr:FHA domain-containing protein [Planctomycetaceae bacterium]MBT6487889.1 FHA domain-containing protein [Planctomycetaceae bacterium]MBT6493966.1 FHA domain-containing protein [Planctomycetaceae bacterium]
MSIQKSGPPPNRLVVQRVDSPQQWEFTDQAVVTIGRSSENDVQLQFPQVSRSHCALFFTAGQWECCSLGKGGVLIEGVRHHNKVVTNRLVIQLGVSGPELRLCLPVGSAVGDSASDGNPAAIDESVTGWLDELKLGNDTATRKIWEYYFESVVDLARRRLGNTPRRAADEEDVALSVFNRLFTGISGGQFPDLSDRDSLWRLLVVMTSRRSIDQIQHDQRQKRGAGMVRGDSALLPLNGEDSALLGFDQLTGDDPTAEYIAMMAEETSNYLSLLEDENMQQIALWKLEGYTNQEIAEMMSLNVRTIERRLQAIRQCWSSMLEDD